MTYILDNIPDAIELAIRARAAAEHKSPEQTILDALASDLGVSEPTQKKQNVSDITGTWEDDPEFGAALAEQRKVDSELFQPKKKQRDLSAIAGKKLITPEMKAIFAEQRQIDTELWR